MKKINITNGAATDTLFLFLVQVITTVMGMAVTKLLSVYFTLDEYGLYSQVMLVSTTVTSLSILGLTNATNYFYNSSKNEKNQKEYVSTIFAIQLVVGLFCGLAIIFLRKNISMYFQNENLKNMLFIIALNPMFVNLMNMYQTLYVSIGEAKKIALRNFAVAILRMAAVIIACFVVKNIVVMVMAITIMDVVQVLYFSILFKKIKFSISIKYMNIHLIKEILYFSIPMAVYVLTNSLSRDLDKYVISAFTDTETLAVYSNASKVLPFDLVTTSLITVLIPIITRQIHKPDYKAAENTFKIYLRTGYIITFILVGGAIGLANPLMRLLYDEKYLPGLSVFVIYLFVDMIRFANVTTILSGAGKTRILMRISVCMLASNLVLNIIAYKALGIIGPAITTLVLNITMNLILLYYGAKEIHCKVYSLFDWKEMVIVGFEILVFAIMAHIVSKKLDLFNLPVFWVLAISYGIYIIIMLGLNYKRIKKCYVDLNGCK